jgi:hypothetical protein
LKIAATCSPACGVRVEGEFDGASREFIHRFLLPMGASSAVRAAATEIEGAQLATSHPIRRTGSSLVRSADVRSGSIWRRGSGLDLRLFYAYPPSMRPTGRFTGHEATAMVPSA